MTRRRIGCWSALLLALLALVLAKPRDEGGPHLPAFERLNAELRAEEPGRVLALLDLDALDANAAAVRAAVRPDIGLRLVTKSLPSVSLLDHLMRTLDTRKLMVFSEPFLEAVLRAFEPGLDILLGKPLPVEAAARLIEGYGAETGGICWLIDSEARLEDYIALAAETEARLRLCVEVDVGLRRGGVQTEEELHAVLRRIQSRPTEAVFGGLMGYEGHVSRAPPLLSADEEFAAVQARYSALVASSLAAFPALFGREVIVNSGGSGTFWRYGPGARTPATEVALGSAFVVPSHFSALEERGLEPALWLAAPVLKRQPGALPFAPAAAGLLARWDPNLADHFFLLSGAWPADVVSPPGLKRHFLWDSGPPVQNLLPNQPLLAGSASVGIGEGDLVFFRPWEGDAAVVTGQLTLLRGGAVVGAWETYREGD